SK
ncbi:lipocalin-like domain protein, partial [Vibrio cholerae HC-17A1]